jgi:hypothetical protein
MVDVFSPVVEAELTLPQVQVKGRAAHAAELYQARLRHVPDELIESDSAGEHLAAIVMLQVGPNLDYLDWLAKRLGVEKPFIGKQAALALLVAARSCDIKEQRIVLRYIEQAKQNMIRDYETTTLIEKMEKNDRAKILNAAK